MSFVDRKKQPHLWRGTEKKTPYPTAEQVVTDVLSGVAHAHADKAVVKAFTKMRLPVPEALASLVVDTVVNAGVNAVKQFAARVSNRKPKAKKKAKAKASPRVNG